MGGSDRQRRLAHARAVANDGDTGGVAGQLRAGEGGEFGCTSDELHGWGQLGKGTNSGALRQDGRRVAAGDVPPARGMARSAPV
ncbi:hypothetical protein ABZ456_24905 [Streptomyces sp. NPDC005776]|uniref:hypothetical protein n=1 Tax=Streptomyces sp. NPDC005776 TaxID=3154676 RepID=UPI0033C84560